MGQESIHDSKTVQKRARRRSTGHNFLQKLEERPRTLTREDESHHSTFNTQSNETKLNLKNHIGKNNPSIREKSLEEKKKKKLTNNQLNLDLGISIENTKKIHKMG